MNSHGTPTQGVPSLCHSCTDGICPPLAAPPPALPGQGGTLSAPLSNASNGGWNYACRRLTRKSFSSSSISLRVLLLCQVLTAMVVGRALGQIAMPQPQMLRIYQDGSYSFAYDTGGGVHQSFRVEMRTKAGRISGRYGYVDPDGVLRVTQYVADAAGYRANEVVYKPINRPPSGDPLIVGPLPNFGPSTTDQPTSPRPSVFDKFEFPVRPYESENQSVPLDAVSPATAAPVVDPTSGDPTSREVTSDDNEFISDIDDLLPSLQILDQDLLLIGPIPPALQKRFKPPTPLITVHETGVDPFPKGKDSSRVSDTETSSLQDATQILRSPEAAKLAFELTGIKVSLDVDSNELNNSFHDPLGTLNENVTTETMLNSFGVPIGANRANSSLLPFKANLFGDDDKVSNQNPEENSKTELVDNMIMDSFDPVVKPVVETRIVQTNLNQSNKSSSVPHVQSSRSSITDDVNQTCVLCTLKTSHKDHSSTYEYLHGLDDSYNGGSTYGMKLKGGYGKRMYRETFREKSHDISTKLSSSEFNLIETFSKSRKTKLKKNVKFSYIKPQLLR